MRRKCHGPACRVPVRFWTAAICLGLVAAAGWFSYYVNTEIKPTLHELAEYQARSATVEAVYRAVSAEIQNNPERYAHFYVVQDGMVTLDTNCVTTAQLFLVNAAQQAMAALPEKTQSIPFGSLTNNSLLSGLGPVWKVSLQPQGYVEGFLRETAQPIAINSVRYSAELVLTVTLNMILDGRTSTLIVEHAVPLASVIVWGQTPDYYAAD